MTVYGTQDLALLVGDEASQERIASIGGDFWVITGARAALGRLFEEGEESAVVVSHGLFRRRFGGQATALGQTINLGGTPFTITGVLPERFRVTFPQQVATGDELRDLDAFISLPLGQEPPGAIITQTARPAPFWVRVVAKLAPTAPISRARSEMEALHASLRREYPRGTLVRTLRVVPLSDKLAEEARPPLLVLFGAVAFVLLIATATWDRTVLVFALLVLTLSGLVMGIVPALRLARADLRTLLMKARATRRLA